MIYVGLDDTDVIDSPGTNQLAFAIAARLAGRHRVERIVRHQLLDDPRVPYTSGNGSASLVLHPQTALPENELDLDARLDVLVEELRPMIVDWCPPGSDPGLCVAHRVPGSIVAWGRRCQRELVRQADARQLAEETGVRLLGLGGTEDGVIGALAAVGLSSTDDGGRIIHLGSSAAEFSSIGGPQPVIELRRYGIEAVLRRDTGEAIHGGTVDLGKKLRPNLIAGRVVLFVLPFDHEMNHDLPNEYHLTEASQNLVRGNVSTTASPPDWQAVKVR